MCGWSTNHPLTDKAAIHTERENEKKNKGDAGKKRDGSAVEMISPFLLRT